MRLTSSTTTRSRSNRARAASRTDNISTGGQRLLQMLKRRVTAGANEADFLASKLIATAIGCRERRCARAFGQSVSALDHPNHGLLYLFIAQDHEFVHQLPQ